MSITTLTLVYSTRQSLVLVTHFVTPITTPYSHSYSHDDQLLTIACNKGATKDTLIQEGAMEETSVIEGSSFALQVCSTGGQLCETCYDSHSLFKTFDLYV